MNAKRTTLAVVIALAVLFVTSLTVLAHPAEMPEISPAAAAPGPTTCYLAQIPPDILAYRLDYLRAQNAQPCPQGAPKENSLVPVTGASARPDRYMAFKDLQADLYSEGYTQMMRRIQPRIDQRFMDFKDRQAESRIP